MRMNTAIPLQVRPANPINALRAGTQARAERDDIAHQNAFRAFMRDQGGAVMSGDQNALAQLAGFSPEAALGIQSQRQQMDLRDRQMGIAEERLGMDRQRFNAQLQSMAADMGAAEAAAEAERLETAVQRALGAQTPEQFDQIVTAYGADQLVGRFAEREQIATGFLDIAEQLRMAAGPEVFQQVIGADLGMTGEDAGKLFNVGPDGKVTGIGGGGVSVDIDMGDDATDISAPASPAAMISAIDGILDDPALPFATGFLAWTQNLPGIPARRFGARARQLEGQAFLQAFESLKGGGHITEIEGIKATQAIGRLDTAQSPDDYSAALEELRGLLAIGMARQSGVVPPSTLAEREGGGALPAPPEGVEQRLWERMTPEQRALWD